MQFYVQGSHIINEMQKPEFLKFYLDASLKGSLNDAKAYYKKIVSLWNIYIAISFIGFK